MILYYISLMYNYNDNTVHFRRWAVASQQSDSVLVRGRVQLRLTSSGEVSGKSRASIHHVIVLSAKCSEP